MTTMDPDTSPGHRPAPGFQQRRGRFQVCVCCCPLTLVLAPFVGAARLFHYGALRMLGHSVAWPWAS
jgi:hypothetical protein